MKKQQVLNCMVNNIPLYLNGYTKIKVLEITDKEVKYMIAIGKEVDSLPIDEFMDKISPKQVFNKVCGCL